MSSPEDAAESDMAGGSVDRLGVTRRRPIAPAVIRRAQMRATLQYPARNSDVGLARVIAVLFAPTARIFGNAARLRRVRLVLCGIKIAGPFPDIADHVDNAVPVRRKLVDRRSAGEAIGAGILMRKLALPGI